MKGRTLIVLLSAFVAAVSVPAALALSAIIIATAGHQVGLRYLAFIYIAIRITAIARGASRYLERLTSHDLALRILPRWREKIYSALVELVPAAIPEKNQGAVLESAVFDVDSLLDFYVRAIIPYLSTIFTTFSLLAIAAIWERSQLPLLAGFVATMAIVLIVNRHLLPYSKRDQIAELSTEVKNSTIEILALQDELTFYEDPSAIGRELNAKSSSLSRMRRRRDFLTKSTSTVLRLIPLVFGAIAVLAAHQGTTTQTVNTTLMIPFSLLGMSDTFSQLGTSRTAFVVSVAAAERAISLSEMRLPRTAPLAPKDLPFGAATLTFSDVSFKYDSGRQVFENLNFTLQPKTHLAIVGPSGIGKTTLLHLATGHLLPTVGEVSINGVPTESLDPETIAQRVPYIPQRPHLFNGTLRYNVLLDRSEIDDDAIISGLCTLGLGEWFKKLPEGLDTVTGEKNGFAPSGGELQRIALTRALVTSPAGVVLDEPGSSLDAKAQQNLIDTVRETFQDVFVMIVTHSEKEMRSLDQIWTIREGYLTQIS